MNGLAPFVAILGRGQGRARALTQAEAFSAMTEILGGRAAPEAIGALLMLLRMKGETAPEIAGFTAAARAHLPPWTGPRPALDWPTYAAGRTRGQPWFLLSAKLVAQAGFPVLLHGWNSHQASMASVRDALAIPGIAQCTWEGAPGRIAADRIAYVPLEDVSPHLVGLLRLRDVLGLRSCINTVLRMLNPAGAAATVQGVFHPPYRELQRDAAHLLGQRDLCVLKGGGGEFEHHPTKDISLHGLRDGAVWAGSSGMHHSGRQRLAETTAPLADVWAGTAEDDFATAIVVSTAALALDTLGLPNAAAAARHLWTRRHYSQAA
ncbi:Anthranilate phosphoribosyltransferase [Jannaschia faecimaris]|uniref:Anthranilate phosphoribosyltransferase n=1 Tax=Jannaschia faecimaris TaxID=1244108 RepID=A0A1H3UBH7_9RHOB|nr:glycosyl transferase family protein [Jannaschia faecimaris]SDZ59746.1 Anthranilate phosphoribosyltransferase [Jannaschia faecimaris]